MAGRDDDTIGFYTGNAAAYTSRGQAADRPYLETFLARLQEGASILELGCGGGQDSEFMLAAGYDVHPTDGTPEIAKAAQARLGIPVRTLLFENIDESARYDGVWANACLLHVPRDQLASVLSLIRRALKPGGVFYASYKEGETGARDTLDRYYNYPSQDWLRATYAEAGNWSSLSMERGEVRGFDDKMAPMLFVTARKAG